MSDRKDIVLTEAVLDPGRVQAALESDDCGAVVLFTGYVRNKSQGRGVVHLEFEAYEPMAINEMEKIADSALEKWPIEKVTFHHRVGVLDIGEIPVVIGVSSAHRDAAFEACRYCIDTLKETVPIWKKEVFEDGEAWVSAHP